MPEPDELFSELPKEGDRLFVKSRAPIDRALAENHAPSKRYFMMEGYLFSGDALLRKCLEGSGNDARRYVWPALFCYRHFLELAMKRLLSEHNPNDDKRHIHDLEALWHECITLFDEFRVSGKEVQAAESIILEMHRLDRRSTNFRYAQDCKGNLVEFADYELAILWTNMLKLFAFFDIANTMISVEQDARSEFWP